MKLPQRIVSLVPSDTETLFELGVGGRLVGRTDFCEEPAKLIAKIPTLGGTKNPRVKELLALRPDLVVVNREENTKRDVEALREAGVPIFLSFPQTVLQAAEHVKRLSEACGGNLGTPYQEALLKAERSNSEFRELRVFVPIWRDPWMSFNQETYAHDLLKRCGLENCFADRARRYPLSEDLRMEGSTSVTTDRDTRYPRFSLEEARERKPDLILLPDEPYRFSEAEHDELEDLFGVPTIMVSGKDLFWYGHRTPFAIQKLRALTKKSLA